MIAHDDCPMMFRAGRQGCDLIRDDVDVSLDRELDQLKMSQVK